MVKDSIILFDNFGGQFVTVITTAKMSQSTETEEGTLLETQPVAIHGFVLDVDNKFLYMGETPNEVDSAIGLGKIVHISIVQEETEENHLKDLLREIPLDEDPEKMN